MNKKFNCETIAVTLCLRCFAVRVIIVVSLFIIMHCMCAYKVWLQSTTNTHAESDMDQWGKGSGMQVLLSRIQELIHARSKMMKTDYIIISSGALI